MAGAHDQIACGVSTGGIGTQTLAAPPSGMNSIDPYAAFSGNGWGTSVGVPVAYSIVEYTDSTFALPKQSESGVGTLLLGASISASTLARTTPLQTVTGMNSQPATVGGQTSAPSAINIGTAANTLVFIGPTSWQMQRSLTAYATSGVSGAALEGVCPFQRPLTGGTNGAWTHQRAVYQRVLLGFSGLIKSVSWYAQAGYTGGTQTMDGAIYAVGSDGRPGKKLLNFNQNSSLVANLNTLTATTQGAVFFFAGYYYMGFLPQFSGGSGSPNFRCADSVAPSPLGTASGTAFGPMAKGTVSSVTTLDDPAMLTAFTSDLTQFEIALAFKSS